MEQIVTPDHFRIRVRQECVGKAQLLPVAPIDFRRANTQRDHANSARFELRKLVLKTPQLGVAERSPKSAIENQRDTF
jgi:hypothetical protein